MIATLLFLFCIVVAYLVGSICSAIIVCRLFDLPDPREEGSKNPGATNVLRIAGKQYAVIVLLADMLKGLLPVLLARLLDAGPITLGFTCFAAVLGHMYPIFFGFKGGKGVATALGALLGFHFFIGVSVIATWLIIANFTHYSSLASMISILLAPFYSSFILKNLSAFPPLMCIAIFVLYQHRNNITRLIDGTEPKINFRSTKSVSNAPLEATPDYKVTKATVTTTPEEKKTKKTAKAAKTAKTGKTAKAAKVAKTAKKAPKTAKTTKTTKLVKAKKAPVKKSEG